MRTEQEHRQSPRAKSPTRDERARANGRGESAQEPRYGCALNVPLRQKEGGLISRPLLPSPLRTGTPQGGFATYIAVLLTPPLKVGPKSLQLSGCIIIASRISAVNYLSWGRHRFSLLVVTHNNLTGTRGGAPAGMPRRLSASDHSAELWSSRRDPRTLREKYPQPIA
jgi:hypothetical protein